CFTAQLTHNARLPLGRNTLPILLSVAVSLWWSTGPACAQGTPIAGFQPLVTYSLTNEYKTDAADITFFFAEPSSSPGGSWLGPGSGPHFELALLDTGAAVSLITHAADLAFNIDAEGFRGTALQPLVGAGDEPLNAIVNDPLGIYAAGLGGRTTPNNSIAVPTSSMVGQTSVSIASLPAEAFLPGILGIPFSSQYTTAIDSSDPQVFRYQGRTVRTPNVSFHELGSGASGAGMNIQRQAPLVLKPSASFQSPPLYVYNFQNILTGQPLSEDPSNPTNIQNGGLFLNVDVQNGNKSLFDQEFFFDTGADVTVVSRLNAVRLGFDPILDEPDFTVPVIGAGGIQEGVPGFYLDELTVLSIGGSLTAQNVPVIVLDVPDPSNSANVVPGIVGTNIFAGRNLVIDPNPITSPGGPPALYISDPVTENYVWSSAAPSQFWQTGSNWDNNASPDELGMAVVNHVSGGAQEAVVNASTQVWSLDVSGPTPDSMTVRVTSDATLTTFSAINIGTGGRIHLDNGNLDAQYVEIVGGTLTGTGTVEAGNGPIPGQVENRDGVVAPEGTLNIVGSYSNLANGKLQLALGGRTAGTEYDQLTAELGVALDGTVEVILDGSGADIFWPRVGDSFTLIDTASLAGEFAVVDLPGGHEWAVRYLSDSVEIRVLDLSLPGDANLDGVVDGHDFDIWNQHKFTDGTEWSSADFNNDGRTDEIDYSVWFAHRFSTLADFAPVPEPAFGVGMAILIGLLCTRQHRRGRMGP
ncbi:MAG: aspartyl protease family protein, partial [Planctomycetales bacterium]|nr:aspartyl protease family protein [Planctomycetales bacterium]